MGLVVATTAGLVIWIVMWALGTKAIDSFLIAILISLVAVTVRMLSPYLPGRNE